MGDGPLGGCGSCPGFTLTPKASAALHQLEWETLDHPHPPLLVTALCCPLLLQHPLCSPTWRETCSGLLL